ncbi:Acetyl-CoA acetyltransferase, mitochondrial [Fragariocoptes setiger]|uniref:Acetyl-CoA acetyltransferase, mitochondrial n=1 Tax=Fragariocoptes setiger TaxID=1670756 RepID=A0ABQ7SDD6_9ACAR|nr:Acetyl-CoA acetyltransferase, mitochondrial [Fragariocoptes setiger]
MATNGNTNGVHAHKDVYIVASTRTPIGSYRGSLSSLPATKLAAAAIKATLDQVPSIAKNQVQKVIVGQAVQAGCGQSAAKQALVAAGLPYTCRDALVNEVCASGMQAIIMATNQIRYLGGDCVVAAGMESMSNAPFYQRRSLPIYGDFRVEDGLMLDGLTDTFNDCSMGVCAEHTAKIYDISRAEQDQYAITSYKRAQAAHENGTLAQEICQIEVPGPKGKPSIAVVEDEEFRKVDFDKVTTLRPVFDAQGTITAANASTLADGAAACILVSRLFIDKMDLKPLAKVVSYGESANDPIDFSTAPSAAVTQAIERAGLTKDDIALWEINEAFSVVALANIKILGLDKEKVNINGGGVSLGHPLGMSGAKIVNTLVHNLLTGQYGCASICRGGGGASAIIIQKL